jgi:hypothetical protein
MKSNRRFFVVSICALLSVLFVFSANIFAAETYVTETDDAYYEGAGHGEYVDSDESMSTDSDEYDKNEYGEEYQEGTEKGVEEFESAPLYPEDEFPTEESSEQDDPATPDETEEPAN